jgi:hypothetical protein
LYPDNSKGGGVSVNIAGTSLNAEDTGIELRFIRPTKWGDGKEVEAKLLPVLDHSQFNGGNGGKS